MFRAAAAIQPADLILDPRSQQLVSRVNLTWRILKRRPLAERESWLKRPEAMMVLGAKRCHELLQSIRAARNQQAAAVPSTAWLEAIIYHGESLPLAEPMPARRHAVRLTLSRAKTRIGEDAEPTRRWTPPQAVDLEDFLDSMDSKKAGYYQFPASPSAIIIQRAEIMGGKHSRVWIGTQRRFR